VNTHLIQQGGLDIRESPVIGVVVETLCQFHKELSFPEVIEAGIAVERLGRTSVKYTIGLFREDDPEPAATGHFVHVYIDRITRQPVPVPDAIRAALEPLVLA
jgi:acyl-CoA thioester hydrolase